MTGSSSLQHHPGVETSINGKLLAEAYNGYDTVEVGEDSGQSGLSWHSSNFETGVMGETPDIFTCIGPMF